MSAKCFATGNYAAMNVQPARKIFSRATADALELLVEDHNYPRELLTTAWFCRKMHRWYDLVNSRSKISAFSMKKPDKYEKGMQDLDEFYYIMETMTFRCKKKGKDGQTVFEIQNYRPFKRGTLQTITGIKILADRFIKEIGQTALLTKVFSTESVENLFSSVRRRKVAPTALEFRYIIRSLIIVKFMKPSKNHNYDDNDGSDEETDENGSKTGFLEEMKLIRAQEKEEREQNTVEVDYPILTGDYEYKDYSEAISLCYLTGYLFDKTICTQSYCEKCEKFLVQDEPSLEVHRLITKKTWAAGAMTYPTKAGYDFFSHCESVFHRNSIAVNRGGEGLDQVMAHLYEVGLQEYNMPECHLELLLNRFHKIRMYFEATQLNNIYRKAKEEEAALKAAKKGKAAGKAVSKAIYASKSMAGHALNK